MIELWTHAFTMICEEDCGVRTTMYAIDSPEHPEALLARLITDTPNVFNMKCVSCGRRGWLGYVRSWDHEPTTAEKEAAGLDAGIEDD